MISPDNDGSFVSVSTGVSKTQAIAILGPTAAGKTALAIALAQQLDTEIISVDSALVYRGLDIGSAKPTSAERAMVPHHLIDICEPHQPYSAADFCRDAAPIVHRLVASGKPPILAGGTMLYFKALLEGLSGIPAADMDNRKTVESIAQAHGWQHVHDLLRQVDPVSADRIHPHHSQRLCRAYEVFLSTGKPMSIWQSGGENGLLDRYRWCQIAIAPRERNVLHTRIKERFSAMLRDGLIEEVQQLRKNPSLHEGLPSIRAVGYRQVWQYLSGDIGFDAMQDQGLAATRQLAKRQLTWLRGWNGLNWLFSEHENGEVRSFDEIVANALNFLGERPL